MDGRPVGTLVALGSVTPADESFPATGVSFFTEGCAAAALGNSSPSLDGSFATPTGGDCATDHVISCTNRA
jgi:hypothetical protein